jgi:large subunit ribosomal protein L21
MAKATDAGGQAAANVAGMEGSAQLYAVFTDGGRQYTVQPGQELTIDFRHLQAGDPVVFDRVLAVNRSGALTLGAPTVKGASVKAEVLGTLQGEKIYVQKFARRKNYRRRTGHRSVSTRVRIVEIAG